MAMRLHHLCVLLSGFTLFFSPIGGSIANSELLHSLRHHDRDFEPISAVTPDHEDKEAGAHYYIHFSRGKFYCLLHLQPRIDLSVRVVQLSHVRDRPAHQGLHVDCVLPWALLDLRHSVRHRKESADEATRLRN